jgi:hypothetical protein
MKTQEPSVIIICCGIEETFSVEKDPNNAESTSMHFLDNIDKVCFRTKKMNNSKTTFLIAKPSDDCEVQLSDREAR